MHGTKCTMAPATEPKDSTSQKSSPCNYLSSLCLQGRKVYWGVIYKWQYVPPVRIQCMAEIASKHDGEFSMQIWSKGFAIAGFLCQLNLTDYNMSCPFPSVFSGFTELSSLYPSGKKFTVSTPSFSSQLGDFHALACYCKTAVSPDWCGSNLRYWPSLLLRWSIYKSALFYLFASFSKLCLSIWPFAAHLRNFFQTIVFYCKTISSQDLPWTASKSISNADHV